MSLYLDLDVGEAVLINSNITMTLEKKSGQRARVKFDADKNVPIRKIEDTGRSFKLRSLKGNEP